MSRLTTTTSTRRRSVAATSVLAVSAVAALAPAGASGAVYGAAPAAHGNRTQIIGGAQIPISRAPYQVYLENATGACGGSIIDATHVLTAAHCTISGGAPDDNPADYVVVAGTDDLNAAAGGNTSAQIKDVVAVRRHPGYPNPPGEGGSLEQLVDDVAVLTVQPLTFVPGQVQPIGIPDAAGANPATGSSAFISGFGLQEDPAVNPSAKPNGRLFGLDTGIAESTAADAAGPLNALYVEAATPNGSTCQGDSGGGLVVGGRVIGVVSSGEKCAANRIGNFSSVSAGENLAFIKAALQDQSLPAAQIPLAPRGGQDVKLTAPSSTIKVGSTLTCSAGTWSNGPTFSYQFLDAATGQVLQDGASATYKPAPSAAGKTVSCRVAATTPGGVGYTPRTKATPAIKALTPAKLSASVTAGSSRVKQRGRVSFAIRVRNSGETVASNVRICARVSSRFALASRGGGTVSGGRLCWTIKSLGGTATTRAKHQATTTTKRFKLRADSDARTGRVTATTVSVTSPGVKSASARRSVTIVRGTRSASPGGVTG